jgi:hypothetical protein
MTKYRARLIQDIIFTSDKTTKEELINEAMEKCQEKHTVRFIVDVEVDQRQ